jgi:hypothetical protein
MFDRISCGKIASRMFPTCARVAANVTTLAVFRTLIVALVVSFANTAHSQSLPCEVILKYAYDPFRGVVSWEKFPKIGVPADDPFRAFLAEKGLPLAEKIWRYLNRLSPETALEKTEHYAIGVKSIEGVDDILKNKSIFTPSIELLRISKDISSQEKLEATASIYLNKRIDAGAKLITSYVVQDRKDDSRLFVAFISPVSKNIRRQPIEVEEFAASLFEVFTNLRIEDDWFLNRRFVEEYKSGCLDGNSARCDIFNLGREFYAHRSEFRSETRQDPTPKLCGYVKM